MPTPKPPKYDEAAHADRVRNLLSKKLDRLPLGALVTLLEAATLLEAGESLGTLAARQKLGVSDPTGKPRYRIEQGMRRSERAMIARHLEDQKGIEAGIEAALEAMPWMRRGVPVKQPDDVLRESADQGQGEGTLSGEGS